MKTQDLMTRSVRTCRRTDSLAKAAQIMWDADLGCLPVLDERLHPIAMITDRDIAMAAHFQGRPLHELRVGTAMSHRPLIRCHPDTALANVEYLMQSGQVKRIPVVMSTGELVGIITLTDILRAAGSESASLPSALQTACAITERRCPTVNEQAAE